MPHMKSTAILDIDYKPETKELTIKFHSGKSYIYYDVPQNIYSDLEGASSVGDYFNRYIDEHYSCRLVE